MTRYFYGAYLGILLVLFFSCEKQHEREERLAKQYCSSCHAFTRPELLPKSIWKNDVLPQMALRMGLPSDSILRTFANRRDLQLMLQSIPPKPLVSKENWEHIVRYFNREAPAVLSSNTIVSQHLERFRSVPVKAFKNKSITLLKADPSGMFVGTKEGMLYRMDGHLSLLDSITLPGTPSHLSRHKNTLLLLTAGQMEANDDVQGKLSVVYEGTHLKLLIDSLRKPIYFTVDDLNGDDTSEYVICNFGNFLGELAVYQVRDKTFVKHVIHSTPGTRRVVVNDINHDGLNDIVALMTRGNEQLVAYTNRGDWEFDAETLIKFPPVYGLNYFEMLDFNNDGFEDILCTNGDNDGFSLTLKPYHAVRIFLNDGSNNFKEAWSHPMHGACKATARDFDRDGDLDIAAISFFPDFETHPEQGFMYFENKGHNRFAPHTTPSAAKGRWLVMEVVDYDQDKDIDILLGAMNFIGFGADHRHLENWRDGSSLTILENLTF